MKKFSLLRSDIFVITILGPRQSGKTTLSQMAFPKMPYVNLEAPDIQEFARTDPRGFLGKFPQGVILDEIQTIPKAFILYSSNR